MPATSEMATSAAKSRSVRALALASRIRCPSPCLGADELADDRPDDRERHRGAAAIENRRQRRGHLQPAKRRPRGSANGAKVLQQVCRRAGEAAHGRDHHREEREHECHQHLRRVAVAEPDHHQRRQRDLRQALEDDDQRIQRAPHDGQRVDRKAEQHAADHREHEAGEHLLHRHPRLGEQDRPVVPHALQHIGQRRQQVALDVEEVDRLLPQHRKDQEQHGGIDDPAPGRHVGFGVHASAILKTSGPSPAAARRTCRSASDRRRRDRSSRRAPCTAVRP